MRLTRHFWEEEKRVSSLRGWNSLEEACTCSPSLHSTLGNGDGSSIQAGHILFIQRVPKQTVAVIGEPHTQEQFSSPYYHKRQFPTTVRRTAICKIRIPCHPASKGIIQTSVRDNNAHILWSEVQTLLAEKAMQTVPLANSESGFYSRYFLVPKKDGGLRPILDHRHLNRSLMRPLFKMLTLKQIIAQIGPEDWFLSVDLNDASFHIQIARHHRPFLRFAFEGVAYQYTVLQTVSGPTHFYGIAPLFPLRQMWICILNYLDDCLVLARSERELITHRSLLLSHQERLELKINLAKSCCLPDREWSFWGRLSIQPEYGLG